MNDVQKAKLAEIRRLLDEASTRPAVHRTLDGNLRVEVTRG
jgi:hypothetical protein